MSMGLDLIPHLELTERQGPPSKANAMLSLAIPDGRVVFRGIPIPQERLAKPLILFLTCEVLHGEYEISLRTSIGGGDERRRPI